PDGQVTDFSGMAGGTGYRHVADDDPAPDSGADTDDRERRCPLARPEPVMRGCQSLDVVAHGHWHPDQPGEARLERHVLIPAEKGGSDDDRTIPCILAHVAGQADAECRHARKPLTKTPCRSPDHRD